MGRREVSIKLKSLVFSVYSGRIQHRPYSSSTATATNLWLHKSGSGLPNSSVCMCQSFDVTLFILCVFIVVNIPFGALSQ